MKHKVLQGSLGDYLHSIVVAFAFSLSINLQGKENGNCRGNGCITTERNDERGGEIGGSDALKPEMSKVDLSMSYSQS